MTSSSAYCPPPSRSVLAAYREIIPALIRQIRDPAYAIARKLPDGVPSVTVLAAA